MDIMFLGIPYDNTELVLNTEESTDLKWFSLEEVFHQNFNTFSDIRIWCKYIIENKNNLII